MMTNIVYYVATSLDAYIATSDSGIKWLSAYEMEGEDYGYQDFYESVDTLVIGSRTYEQILNLGAWPYPEKPCWVLSRRQLTVEQPEVTPTSLSPQEIVSELRGRGLKRVWLVGGGQLATSFRRQGLIDEYIVSVMPIILGSGISLFGTTEYRENLDLVECKSYPSGCVQLHYLTQNHINKSSAFS
jgi:dihydrofolate reductase